jgi:hypothetical protein|uniref:Uncharacterized protein n=1 Tax=uncultured prokaryote TaxID=198431 RepID=A0A0H5QHU2_9ZZZZ|nr:hypothetical protein [uncultured prokaryote]
MSMLSMTGKVIHLFETPKGKNKAGEEFGGQDKVQVMGAVPLQNGETRYDLITLTCHDANAFEPFMGQEVSFPIGVMAPSKGQIVYFIPKGAIPSAVDSAAPVERFGSDRGLGI